MEAVEAPVAININTLERRLRELREKGILERAEKRDERGRQRVILCIRRDLYQALMG